VHQTNPPQLSVMEALIRIESRQFLKELNATLDYSYLDTPRSGAPIRSLALSRTCHLRNYNIRNTHGYH
jgi:hypothetical protein